MEQDKKYLVYIYIDERTGRITGSSALRKYLDRKPKNYEVNEKVNLLIGNPSNLGYNVIINNTHSGLIFRQDIFQPIETGQKVSGFIKKIREDNQLDIVLHAAGYQKVGSLAGKVLDILHENGGYMEVSDTSSPELIYKLFGMSKKTFKKALGALYKRKLIKLQKDSLQIIQNKTSG